MHIDDLQRTAIHVRKRLMQLIYEARAGHTGGSLSSVDILVSLYFKILKNDPANPGWEERDRFIMSKGHSVEGYFCVLQRAGYFTEEVLSSYGKYKAPLAGHPTRNVPGVELNSGSLGHGLSVGTGMALSFKRDNKSNRVFVLMGDGEQGEGSIMEAANAGGHYKLDNLTAIIDRNRLQISGNTEDVMALDDLEERWSAYGWAVKQVNGNSIPKLLACFESLPFTSGKPNLVIANTTKGKGISFIENNAAWHHKVPNEQQYKDAISELDKMMEELNHGA